MTGPIVKRVLITGASGLIGRSCVPMLAASGYEVHAVSRGNAGAAGDNVHWHMANLLDPGQTSELLRTISPTHLLHLAWYVVPGDCWDAPENIHWLKASLGLMEEFATQGGVRAVMAGSCAEYDWRYGCCSEDLTPLAPRSLYGASKHSLQQMLEAFSKKTGLSSAWGRIFFLYGPNEHPKRLVSSVVRSLLLGQPIECSHGNQVRDYLYVDDVADAFVTLLESEFRGAINIGSGHPAVLKDIIYSIAAKLGRADLVRMGARPAGPEEQPVVMADCRRLSGELGWRPRLGLEEGIELTIQWWRERLASTKP